MGTGDLSGPASNTIMPGNHPRLEKSTLTFNILCLVLAILDWPVNILNFIIPLLDDVYFFEPGYYYRYRGDDGARDLAVSVLGLIFVIVAISQAAFQFCPVVIHSMDLDRKIRPRLRLRWLLAYASESTVAYLPNYCFLRLISRAMKVIETVYLILTAAFGFSYAGTRYTFERGDHYNAGVSPCLKDSAGESACECLISKQLYRTQCHSSRSQSASFSRFAQ